MSVYERLCEDHDFVVELRRGGFIGHRRFGEKYEYGAEVTVYDRHGVEVGQWLWTRQEWRAEPELVIGAILSMAADTVDPTGMEQLADVPEGD